MHFSTQEETKSTCTCICFGETLQSHWYVTLKSLVLERKAHDQYGHVFHQIALNLSGHLFTC